MASRNTQLRRERGFTVLRDDAQMPVAYAIYRGLVRGHRHKTTVPPSKSRKHRRSR